MNILLQIGLGLLPGTVGAIFFLIKRRAIGFKKILFTLLLTIGCRTDFADIQNKKECGGNRQWQNHYLRNWAANTKGKGII